MKVLEVIHGRDKIAAGARISVAALSGDAGVPKGESMLVLEHYSLAEPALWKLLDGRAAAGVTRLQDSGGLTPGQCNERGGRVEGDHDKGCADTEVSLGRVLFMKCPCVCCVPADKAPAAPKYGATVNDNDAVLRERLRTGDVTAKGKAADLLWQKFPDSRRVVEDAMESDRNPAARQRIAQTLAIKHKNIRAIAALRQVIRDADTNSYSSASSLVWSAIALKEATGELSGVGKILVLIAKPGRFKDIEGSTFAYAKRDGLRTMATSHLIDNAGSQERAELHDALKSYIDDVEAYIKESPGRERRHWEGRLTTLLEMALRADMPDLASPFESKKILLNEKREQDRLKRVIEATKIKKKQQRQ